MASHHFTLCLPTTNSMHNYFRIFAWDSIKVKNNDTINKRKQKFEMLILTFLLHHSQNIGMVREQF